MLRISRFLLAFSLYILLHGTAFAGIGQVHAFYVQSPLDGAKRVRVDIYLRSISDNNDFYVDFSKSIKTKCPNDLRTAPEPSQNMFTRTYGVALKGVWVSRSAVFESNRVIGNDCLVRPHAELLDGEEKAKIIELRNAQEEGSYLGIKSLFSGGSFVSPYDGVIFSPAVFERPGGHARSTLLTMVAFVAGGAGREMEVVKAEMICSAQPRKRYRLIAQYEDEKDAGLLRRFSFLPTNGWPNMEDVDSCRIAMFLHFPDVRQDSDAIRTDVEVLGGGRLVAVGRLIGEKIETQGAK